MVTGHIDRHFSLKMNRIRCAGGHISFEPCTIKIRKPIYYQKQIYYLCTGSHLRNLFVWGCDGLMNAGKPGLVCVDEGLLV